MDDQEIIVGSIVTERGSEKLTAAAHDGRKVDIKYLVVGDGGGEYYVPETSQTELKNECWQGEIKSYNISPDDPKQLVIKAEIPSSVGHFIMREIGIKDNEGELIALTNTGDLELVPYSSGQILNLDVTFYVQFRSAEIGAVNIVVNPTDQELLKQEILQEVNQLVDGKLENVDVTLYVCDEQEIKEVVGIVWDDPYEDVNPDCDCDDLVEADNTDIDGMF